MVLIAIWALAPWPVASTRPCSVSSSRPDTPVGADRPDGPDLAGVGVGGLLFRTVHLFFIRDVQTGLVWMTKILTDPFHDSSSTTRPRCTCCAAN
jgi:hypothetical protein